MRWGCGIAHVILAAERDDDTRVINGMRRWLYGRAVHQDHLARDNPATLVCRTRTARYFRRDGFADQAVQLAPSSSEAATFSRSSRKFTGFTTKLRAPLASARLAFSSSP